MKKNTTQVVIETELEAKPNDNVDNNVDTIIKAIKEDLTNYKADCIRPIPLYGLYGNDVIPYKYTFKDYITYNDMINFCKDFISLCVDKDGKYTPYKKSFVDTYCIIKYFTDLPYYGLSIEEIYKMHIYSSFDGILQEVKENMQYKEMKNAIDEMIEIKKAEDAKKTNSEEISKTVNGLIGMLLQGQAVTEEDTEQETR